MSMQIDAAFFDQVIDRCCTDCEKWDGLRAREGREMLPMWVADMDFRCPPEVTDALVARAKHPVYGYTDQTDAAVDAMLSFMSRRHGVTLTREQQAVLPCVVTGLRAAVRTLTAPGDGVLIITPVYGPFFDVIRDNGRKVIEVPLLADANGYYTMDFAGLESALRAGVKLLLLCNPQNPVGRVWTREELDRLYGRCREHGATLISDEIHMDFVYERGAFTSALKLDESEQANIAVLTSASKTFNLAGLKQATLLTRNLTLQKMLTDDMRRAGVVAGNIFSYAATEAAYRYGDEWLDALIAYLDAGHRLLRAELNARLPKAIMSPLEATYLAWVDLRAYGLSTADMMRRTYANNVAFTSGLFFGKELGEGFLRINFACPHSQIREAVIRLENAILRAEA